MVSDCPKRVQTKGGLMLRAESERCVDRHQLSSTVLDPCALTAVNYLGHHLSLTETNTCTYTCVTRIIFPSHTCTCAHRNTHTQSHRGGSLWLWLLVGSMPQDPTALPFLFVCFISLCLSLFLSICLSPLSACLSLSDCLSQPKLGIQSASHP